MFESITFRNSTMPGPMIDVGAVAESLIYYGEVSVIAGIGTLEELLSRIPPFVLLDLLKYDRLTVHLASDNIGIQTSQVGKDELHNLVTFSNLSSEPRAEAERRFREAAGNTSQAKLGGRKFVQLLRSLDHSAFDQNKVYEAMADAATTESVVRTILRIIAPGYVLPHPLRFRLQRAGGSGFAVDTNIDYPRANAMYSQIIPPSHSSLTAARLLSMLQYAQEELYYAASFNSEIATDRVHAQICMHTVDSYLQRRSRSETQLSQFEEVALDGAKSIKEAVNSGVVPFSEILRLLDSADKFREWIRKQPPDANLLTEYYQAVISETWADRLPTKTVRWGLFTGTGVALDVALTGGIGTAIGVAVSALDAFVIDKMIQGWKPHHFIERELKPVLLTESKGPGNTAL
jgi:hypothetical protein